MLTDNLVMFIIVAAVALAVLAVMYSNIEAMMEQAFANLFK